MLLIIDGMRYPIFFGEDMTFLDYGKLLYHELLSTDKYMQ